jgi:hypothetical protein
VSADELAALRELSPDVGVNASDLLGDRDRMEIGQEVLDKRGAAGARGSGCAMNAVQQLTNTAIRPPAQRPAVGATASSQRAW